MFPTIKKGAGAERLNDAADAEAIYEAALRPTMRFVPVKSIAQQDLRSLHRARERVVCARTALINHGLDDGSMAQTSPVPAVAPTNFIRVSAGSGAGVALARPAMWRTGCGRGP
jgi:hypothetical protein